MRKEITRVVTFSFLIQILVTSVYIIFAFSKIDNKLSTIASICWIMFTISFGLAALVISFTKFVLCLGQKEGWKKLALSICCSLIGLFNVVQSPLIFIVQIKPPYDAYWFLSIVLINLLFSLLGIIASRSLSDWKFSFNKHLKNT